MIISFRDKRAENLFNGVAVNALPPDIQRPAMRKLKILHNATSLQDLRVPPGNHLEVLRGDRAGQYSIRINSQWRICFVWDGHDAWQVEIADYH